MEEAALTVVHAWRTASWIALTKVKGALMNRDILLRAKIPEAWEPFPPSPASGYSLIKLGNSAQEARLSSAKSGWGPTRK